VIILGIKRIILLIILYGLMITSLWLGALSFRYMSTTETIDNPYEPISVTKVISALNNVGVILILLVVCLVLAICILLVYYTVGR